MADDYYNGDRYRDRSRSLSRSPRGRSRSRSLDRRRSYSRSPRRSYSRSYSRSPSRSPRRSRRYQSRSWSRSPKYRRSYSRSRSRSPYRRRRRSYSRSPSRSPRRSYGRRYRSRSPRGGGRGTRWNPEPSRVLGVFGLSLYTTERELRDLFSKYGDIEKVQVIHDHITGRSRGFSFVYFRDYEDAQDAKAETNGIEVDGRRIRVDFSITSRAHSPTPGKYMGRPTRVRRYSRSRSRSR